MEDDLEPAVVNEDLERLVLGAVIAYGKSTYRDFLRLNLSDFHAPKNELVATVLRDMINHGDPIDVITVSEEMRRRQLINRIGGSLYLHDLLASAPQTGANLGYYAEILRQRSITRQAESLGIQLTRYARGYHEAGDDVTEVLNRHRADLEALPRPLVDAAEQDSDDHLGVILREIERPNEALIPGYIHRQDRHVLVSGEGWMKTTLMRQHAVCLAAGLHPWTGNRVADGMRVLYIDAENSRDQSRRGYRAIVNRAMRATMAPDWMQRIIHKTRNEGIDLINRDAQWFRDTAARVNPDVIIMGPAYKLFRPERGMDAEAAAMALFAVIDEVRVRQDCAVLIEAHAPHGQMGTREMRPYGASAWLRWPEVGIGYVRDPDVPEQERRPEYLAAVDWRGSREDRDWPTHICHGGPTQLPWVPTHLSWKPSVDFDYVIPVDEQGE
jgi:hypothetical protein